MPTDSLIGGYRWASVGFVVWCELGLRVKFVSHQTFPNQLKSTKICERICKRIGEEIGEKIGLCFPGSRSIVSNLGVTQPDDQRL